MKKSRKYFIAAGAALLGYLFFFRKGVSAEQIVDEAQAIDISMDNRQNDFGPIKDGYTSIDVMWNPGWNQEGITGGTKKDEVIMFLPLQVESRGVSNYVDGSQFEKFQFRSVSENTTENVISSFKTFDYVSDVGRSSS